MTVAPPDPYPVRTRKKLIEVALPLEAINVASAREKSIRHGHPSTLHLWWARRPLAAARAVIFSQMVDDPSEYVDLLRDDPKLRRTAESILKARLKKWHEARDLVAKAEGTGLDVPEPGPEPTLDEILADQERQRLFRIIEQLVLWENTTNETVLQAARDEIWSSWRRTCLDNIDHPRAKELFDRHMLPAFHDPFAGGGALPLEAQRLGLEAYASDLNPVAVLINKAMIEIPPKFAGQPPVNPASRADKTLLGKEWRGAQGLAEDVRYYGQWMRDEAEKRIGYLYPKVEITAEMVRERPDLAPYKGRSLTVIAWLWARTVKSPNPAFAHVDVPLASTFMLSTKPGKEAYVQPVIEDGGYRFTVKVGKPKDPEAAKNGTKLARANFSCLMSGSPVSGDHIKAEGVAGRMGSRLMAIVAEGDRGKVYLAPTAEHEAIARSARPSWRPELMISGSTQYLGTKPYGMDRFDKLFTERQLVALVTFSDLAGEVRERVRGDAAIAHFPDDPRRISDGGGGTLAYAEGVSVYLGCAVDRGADYWSSLAIWAGEFVAHTFGRQALPMTWDYAECNPISHSTGSWDGAVEWVARVVNEMPATRAAWAVPADAAQQELSRDRLVSTDPPYYDNVPYADLSDFFYVWLRRSIGQVYPDLFPTVAAPKEDELVAFAYRHPTGKDGAQAFFLDGMTLALRQIANQSLSTFPVSIYYAFKQAESDGEAGTSNTGWDTFLGAVMAAGFAITGTWPMRTERPGRLRETGSNALASSIVLICRKRRADAQSATRRDFVSALKAEMPAAIGDLQRGNIAPVDLEQAAIGPGMAIYTRYAKVVDAEGRSLTVRGALGVIQATLVEALTRQEGDFDADSRWAVTWYEQFGFGTGPYGVAETLSTAKNTSVAGMVAAGILVSKAGEVRLLRPDELDPAWDPALDDRRPAWQVVHQLILAAEDGEAALAALIAKLGTEADVARELAYRLYVLANRKKRTGEAGWYNGLVQSWTEAARLAAVTTTEPAVQGQLFGEG